MNPYLQFVSDLARLTQQGKSLPLGQFAANARPVIPANAPKVLYFAPHPDDETIIGGLALRLLREAKWNVTDVAVTQGSNKARQAGRLQELQGACNFIGFNIIQTSPNGLEKVTPKTREQDPAFWAYMVKVIADIIAKEQPRVVFFPHDNDWNGTHIGVHYLVTDALKTLAGFECYVVETEFWGQMFTPNLMVEYDAEDVATLVAATSFHVEEVRRNPYHVLIPAWMMDNVRRGAEVVGGQGGTAPDYMFGQLFRLRKWTNGKLEYFFQGGKNLSKKENPAGLFPGVA